MLMKKNKNIVILVIICIIILATGVMIIKNPIVHHFSMDKFTTNINVNNALEAFNLTFPKYLDVYCDYDNGERCVKWVFTFSKSEGEYVLEQLIPMSRDFNSFIKEIEYIKTSIHAPYFEDVLSDTMINQDNYYILRETKHNYRIILYDTKTNQMYLLYISRVAGE